MATNYNYFGGIVTNGLVLDLDAAKVASYPGTGTAWYDISGNNNNGTLINGPTFSGIGKQASIVFDGVDDNVQISNSTSTNIIGSGITVSVWVKFSNVGNYKTIFVKDNPTSNSSGYQVYISNTERSRWGITTSNGFNYMFGTVLSTNTWYNILGKYDGTTNYLYENGVLVNSQSCVGNIVDSSNFSIYMGRYRNEELAGNISIAQIYNRSLSASEVTQNYNALRGRYGI